ncbi:predicted protein [Streptomyces viridosporus ATCC 14672]|uniref:Predicted protein n=1 Tax=Streptomyces viridosporus (strain ATCC 14672 / DSM 40746 / JCM 4963 / KCTC 9882 / NRRL B-12104 / FH 1290) TaxID=566461 RepID=D5ZNU3_STRV1|nr:predicted protein [Streptomyces viridosporus ATCC 14672]
MPFSGRAELLRDPVVECLRRALGTHRAACADLLGPVCRALTVNNSSGAALRQASFSCP